MNYNDLTIKLINLIDSDVAKKVAEDYFKQFESNSSLVFGNGKESQKMKNIISINSEVKFGNVLEKINKEILVDVFYCYLNEEDQKRISCEYIVYKDHIVIILESDNDNRSHFRIYDETEFDNEVERYIEKRKKREENKKTFEIETLKEKAMLL